MTLNHIYLFLPVEGTLVFWNLYTLLRSKVLNL
jgi:hypothetical protein